MSILISGYEISKSFGARPLFRGLTFAIESGERIGLIGPNGAGKSTLLKVLAGLENIDSGNLTFQKGLKVGYLQQVPEFKSEATILSTVMEGIQDQGEDNWEAVGWAEECLSKLSLTESLGTDSSTLVSNLSGGWQKRVALARELARKPDLLLLDEPTNHLDVESILWLETFLSQAQFAVLTITHDRAFLQKIANRILELDRRNINGLLSVKGSYTDYISVKSQLLADQKQRETVLKNTLRRETEWLQRGAKARTTKQQARIYRAEDLKQEVSDLTTRNQNRSVKIEFQDSEKSPKKLIEAKRITKSYSGKTLFKDFSLILTHGSRIGILGKNGTGKSTLIRVLLGQEEPDFGEVFRSEQLKLAYFEQNRSILDPEKTLIRTLCPTGDQVIFQRRSLHIRSYLDRFLFDSSQMEMPVGKLSGGEQSRVLIAQLMLTQANLLVLDEPTNDLDLATLSVLEECLTEFEGAVVLITHDRYFLDQVTDQIFAFPTEGSEIRSFADLSQWEEWRRNTLPPPVKAKKPESPVAPEPQKKKKLSFNEQRELNQMEDTILKAETELTQWTEESIKPENLSQPLKLREIAQSMAKAQENVDQLYKRWSELSEKAKG